METKFCHACQTEKPISEFSRNRCLKDGRNTQCKVCHYKVQRRWLAKNPQKRLEYNAKINEREKKRYAEDEAYREYVKKNAKEWRKKVGPEYVSRLNRKHRMAREYGLTIEQVDAMLIACGNLCEICRDPKKKKLGVDHCHKKGNGKDSVRGILCRRCNVAIASLGDTVVGLMRAVEYLRRFETEPEN